MRSYRPRNPVVNHSHGPWGNWGVVPAEDPQCAAFGHIQGEESGVLSTTSSDDIATTPHAARRESFIFVHPAQCWTWSSPLCIGSRTGVR